MIRKKREQSEPAHSDGVVSIYDVSNINKGGKPKFKLTFKEKLFYQKRIIGLQRFFSAQQANIRIDFLMLVPKRENVSTQDIAINHDGRQYDIKLIQYPPEHPGDMLLSLQEVVQLYEIS